MTDSGWQTNGAEAMKKGVLAIISFLFVALASSPINAGVTDCPPLDSTQKQALISTHVFGGLPTEGAVLVRRGYVAQYDAVHRVPRWVAWHAAPEFRNSVPARSGPWDDFHSDPDLSSPIMDDDYKFWHGSEFNFARGHLAPYFIMGGDRDGDGNSAANAANQELDIDDACTVYEANYLSNVAPQFHSRFNGSGGLWNKLESKVRELVDAGKTFHIIAGTIFGELPTQHIGPLTQITVAGEKKTLLKGPFDIGVPHMFFKLIIAEQGVVPFLFVHTDQIESLGCTLEAELEECISTVADVESLTGLDFFRGLNDAEEQALESSNAHQIWQELTSGN